MHRAVLHRKHRKRFHRAILGRRHPQRGARAPVINMQTKWKVLVVTLVCTVIAFMFGPGSPQGAGMWESLWPFGPEERAEPPAGLLPMFMVMGVLEGVMLGLAISLLIWGRKAFVDMAGDTTRGTWMWIATAWIMGNWWIHDSLHIVNELDFTGLLIIDYAFHLTLMAAGVYLAYAVTMAMRGRATSAPAATTA